jgi:hypothetical protein
MAISGWVARLQHDLVKRMLWLARDRRDMAGTPSPGELLPHLVGDEGQPVAPEALWQALRSEAPAEAPAEALDAFGQALQSAVAAARAGDLEGVLALEAAFQKLGAILAGRG